MLGVEHTTVERVEFDEDEQLLVAACAPDSVTATAVWDVCAAAEVMTRARVGGAGGRWIWARCRAYDTGTNLNELRGYFLPLPVFPATTVFFPCLVQRGVHR